MNIYEICVVTLTHILGFCVSYVFLHFLTRTWNF